MPSLTSRRDPVRLALSRAPWASFWYLFGYLFIGAGLCAVVLSVGAAGAALGITLAGLPVLISAALVIRRCADAERTRLRLVTDAPARARYRAPSAPGLLASLRVRWTDPVTWRDIAYLAGLYLPLAALDLTVVTVWLSLLAGITLPAWYWAPWQSVHGVSYHGYPLGYFPNGPHGHPGWGLYVDSLPKALLTALVCLAGFLLFNYVLVATARAHAHVARSLLSDPVDPLEEAKEILRGPGPLSAAEAASHPVFREQCF